MILCDQHFSPNTDAILYIIIYFQKEKYFFILKDYLFSVKDLINNGEFCAGPKGYKGFLSSGNGFSTIYF